MKFTIYTVLTATLWIFLVQTEEAEIPQKDFLQNYDLIPNYEQRIEDSWRDPDRIRLMKKFRGLLGKRVHAKRFRGLLG
uniref:Secreted peptide prohormone-13 n=1 Tax=Schmidtea mediterranea TaxID=79327 RepID=E3CTK4_SCHMD|nr:TPA_inf: secreted peptide prohormone-13 [Schmidtea mediterranea]